MNARMCFLQGRSSALVCPDRGESVRACVRACASVRTAKTREVFRSTTFTGSSHIGDALKSWEVAPPLGNSRTSWTGLSSAGAFVAARASGRPGRSLRARSRLWSNMQSTWSWPSKVERRGEERKGAGV
jgi:hypothetical protein